MDEEKNEYVCEECGADVKEDDLQCPKCGKSFEELHSYEYGKATPIGGWLIVPAISVILAPLALVRYGIELRPLVKGEMWEMLTSRNSASYDPMWAPFLIFIAAFTILLFAFSIAVCLFFFRKRSFVPKMMIVYYFAVNCFLGANHLLVAQLSKEKTVLQWNDGRFALQLSVSIIWICYFLVSKRVKATFVN